MHDTTTHPDVLTDWVSDVVAIESQIEEALDHQLKLSAGSAEVQDEFTHLHATVRASKKRAVAFQEKLGATPTAGIMQKGSEIIGKAAGMIDRMRKDAPAKALRDDYVAFNLAAISYSALHTTALALADEPTQRFAEEGLRTYAGLVMRINNVLPRAIVDDLIANDDIPVQNPDVVQTCREMIDRAWADAAQHI